MPHARFSDRRRHWLLLAATLMICATSAFAEAPNFFKGVTVSCQTWGGEWQTPEMAATLDELKSLGANSFAIHPYARIMNDGHVRFRVVDNQRHITVPLDWARERGMSVMVVPHIAYWGSKFSWRGEINFERAEEWDNFFTDYETWIVEMARLAEAASRGGLLCRPGVHARAEVCRPLAQDHRRGPRGLLRQADLRRELERIRHREILGRARLPRRARLLPVVQNGEPKRGGSRRRLGETRRGTRALFEAQWRKTVCLC